MMGSEVPQNLENLEARKVVEPNTPVNLSEAKDKYHLSISDAEKNAKLLSEFHLTETIPLGEQREILDGFDPKLDVETSGKVNYVTHAAETNLDALNNRVKLKFTNGEHPKLKKFNLETDIGPITLGLEVTGQNEFSTSFTFPEGISLFLAHDADGNAIGAQYDVETPGGTFKIAPALSTVDGSFSFEAAYTVPNGPKFEIAYAGEYAEFKISQAIPTGKNGGTLDFAVSGDTSGEVKGSGQWSLHF